MSSRKKAQVAFVSALALLVLSGLAAYVTINRLVESEKWVKHTLEVRAVLGDVESAFAKAGRARSGYVILGDSQLLGQFEDALPELDRNLLRLQELTRDNPKQVDLCKRLKDVAIQRVDLLRESIQLKKQAVQDQEKLSDIDRRSLPLATEMTSITRQMRAAEEQLLQVRGETSHRLFVLAVVILVVAFMLALELLALHYRLLSAELKAREEAEQSARSSEESLRRLTGRLLQLQDAERRKFSRELHDSLGQYLVGVKLNLEMFKRGGQEHLLAEATQLLDQSIAETRTISHLLHPPLLDEAGFSSAAKWYLEGFAQRSGIEVKVDLPEDASRLPRPVALGLFRVLQESLTNIHRHSGSSRAEVELKIFSDHALLSVRDFGRGISPGLLDSFKSNGTNAGVGLAGMRERVRELGGHLQIEACSTGTFLSVTMPIVSQQAGAESAAAD